MNHLLTPSCAAGVLACLLGTLAGTSHAQQTSSPKAPPAIAPATQPEATPVDTFKNDPAAMLGFTMKSIEGKPVKLEEYAGQVVLFVNVASACGLTPQYEGLQELFEKYEDRGLIVLGFPANNFGGQEPGTDEDILEFCTGKYNVTFPMFSKIDVIGEDRHPLYAKLAKATEDRGGEPTWNFTKYLVNREGKVVTRFDPRSVPNDAKLIEELERLLAEPAPAGAKSTEDKPA